MAIITASIALEAVVGQEDVTVEPTPLSEIPARFFEVQDSKGFFWQAVSNGALTSGETQYLQSGLNLIVGGQPFQPSKALERNPASTPPVVDLELEEVREGFTIVRNLWFDTDRGGVRVLDTIRNTGGIPQTVSLQLRTTYPFPWQSLHGAEGGLLSSEPTLSLGERDTAVVAHFSPSDGRHDTIFLVSSEKGAQKPELSASANLRELSFSYDLKIPPGESRSVLHWILQRNLPALTNAAAELQPFFQRARLVDPKADFGTSGQVANFGSDAFPAGTAASPNLKSLLALNSLMDRIGVHRRSEDILWVSVTNQISGTVRRDNSLTVVSPTVGEQVIPMSRVAALKGAAGIGRPMRVFLRDGQVLSGEIKGTVDMTTAGAEAEQTLDPSTLNLILLASEPGDGTAPANATHYLETTGREVIALEAGEAVLDVLGAEGPAKVPLGSLAELAYVSRPSPRFRLARRDGSLSNVFLPGANVELNTVDGERIAVETNSISRIWQAGATELKLDESEERWFDFSEVPSGLGTGANFLLAGNNLRRGTLGDTYLSLEEGSTRLRLAAEQIANIQRMVDVGDASGPEFEFELKNGERIKGGIHEPFITIANGGERIRVPAANLFSFRVETP